MNHVLTWFEIPVADMARAKSFYATLMDLQMRDESMSTPDGSHYDMAILAGEEGCVTGMLIKGKGYNPAVDGAVVYLNGGSDIEARLATALENGAELLLPKTSVDGGSKGYFCQFRDTEGNRVGLYSAPQ
ncbi:MAG: VOC family protein [Gammaproteobacteria bacterium]|nr:VOC family protein [Gammaproteobacteria bacterium]